jgi:phosphatidylglycerophosphatase A
LAALPPGLLIAERFGASGLLIGAALAYGLGHWASTVWINGTEDKDPSPIVIDEVAGLWLTLTLAPLTPLGAALAFGVFRFFDIVKPWPVRWADKNIGGATGIMLDDILAGIWAALVLLAAREFGLI